MLRNWLTPGSCPYLVIMPNNHATIWSSHHARLIVLTFRNFHALSVNNDTGLSA